MPEIVVYTTPYCPYCVRAKRLLSSKGVPYQNIDLYDEPKRRDEMIARTGGRTSVPQIFIDGQGIGGCDELHELDRKGELDRMLGLPG